MRQKHLLLLKQIAGRSEGVFDSRAWDELKAWKGYHMHVGIERVSCIFVTVAFSSGARANKCSLANAFSNRKGFTIQARITRSSLYIIILLLFLTAIR